MFTIDGKPSIDLASFVDCDALLALRPYFMRAIVESWQYCKPTRYRLPCIKDQSLLPLNEAIDDALAHPERFPSREFLDQLIQQDWLASYLRFAEPVSYGSMTLNLQYIKSVALWDHGRGDPANVARTPAFDNFSFFFNWLDQQNIFQAVGRTSVYVTEAHMQSIEHNDLLPAYHQTDIANTQFIWINLDQRKKFYIRDDSNQKHYVNSTIATFDDRNFHGVDASPYAGWTLRVDGCFSEEFLVKSRLNNYYTRFK